MDRVRIVGPAKTFAKVICNVLISLALIRNGSLSNVLKQVVPRVSISELFTFPIQLSDIVTPITFFYLLSNPLIPIQLSQRLKNLTKKSIWMMTLPKPTLQVHRPLPCETPCPPRHGHHLSRCPRPRPTLPVPRPRQTAIRTCGGLLIPLPPRVAVCVCPAPRPARHRIPGRGRTLTQAQDLPRHLRAHDSRRYCTRMSRRPQWWTTELMSMKRKREVSKK